MHTNRLLRFIGLGLIGAALPLAAVNAETTACTPITSLPTVITVQGVYCFTGDLATAMAGGNAIEIQTNNVTIDLNGHKLGGQAAGPGTTAKGMFALNRKNITLKNGSIRGFYYGVYLEAISAGLASSGGHVLEDLRADGNTFVALEVMGRGNLIRNNQVVNTGGSSLSIFSGFADVFGIAAYGPGARVLNNDVIGTTASSDGIANGILVGTGAGSAIENNRIAETTSAILGSALGISVVAGSDASSISGNRIANGATLANSYGIRIESSSGLTVRDNSISNMAVGIGFLSASTGVYMGSLVFNGVVFNATNFVGGTPAGTNYP